MALPTASDNPFPSILLTEGTVPSTPAAGKQRLYIDSTTHVLKYVNSSGTASNVGSGGSSLTTGEAVLGADVTIVNGSGTTLYDGPSVSLVAGDYVVNFQAMLQVIIGTSQSYEWFVKLWDGTNIFGQSYAAFPVTGNYNGFSIMAAGTAKFTLGSTQTVKLTVGCTRSASASKICRDDASFGLTSHMGTKFSYIKTA